MRTSFAWGLCPDRVRYLKSRVTLIIQWRPGAMSLVGLPWDDGRRQVVLVALSTLNHGTVRRAFALS